MQFEWNQIPFGPFVMRLTLPNYIVDRLYIDGKEQLKNFSYALAGHFNNQFIYNPDTTAWFYNEIGPIMKEFRNQHCKFLGFENLNVEYSGINLWVNFMKSGDFNPIHTHSGDLSFVIFLDVPKELQEEQSKYIGTSAPPGSLAFSYAIQARPSWSNTGAIHIPKTGDMLIFPAMLQHWVFPFKSDVTRVSVSGNLEIDNREKLPNDYF